MPLNMPSVCQKRIIQVENKKHRSRKKDELKTKIGIEHDRFDEMCERVTCEVDGDICVFWDRKIETERVLRE